MSLRDLLNILEGNEVLVPVKGSFRTWKPRLVFFTSDRPWQQWCFRKGPPGELSPLSPEEEAQLGRRIATVKEFRTQVTLNAALGMPELGGDSLPRVEGGDHNTVRSPPIVFNAEGLELEPLFIDLSE